MLKVLLSLIFIRPFISSLAFPCPDFLYSSLLLIVTIAWIIYRGIPLNKIKALGSPLILFCSALIISTVFSIDKLHSLDELLKYITYLSAFIIAASLTENEKTRLIQVIVFAGFIISLLAIYQYLFGFKNLLNYAQKYNITNAFTLDYITRQRVFFPFVTPNILAGYLIMIIPLAAIDKSRRWFILPLSVALLLTKSVGALASLFAAITLTLILAPKFRKKGFMLLAALLLITGIVIIQRNLGYAQHTKPLFSVVMRLKYWQDTIRLIMERPLTGIGAGNFNLAYARYAHNSYLQLWAELGIIGILSILWLVVSIGRNSLQKLKGSRDKKQIACFIAASAAFLLHNLIDFSFFLPEISLIPSIILSLLISY